MGTRVKLSLLVSLLFIAAIGNTYFNFYVEQNGENKLTSVNHTHNVLLEAEVLLSYIKDAETGQRGFIITNDATYLIPFYQGTSNAKKSFNKLTELTQDNEAQQEKLAIINKNMQLKFDELKKTIELSGSQHDEAVALVKKDFGKQYMDIIRVTLDEFISDEKVLLEQRKGDFRENRAILFTVIIIEVMFFCFLAVITIMFITKNLFNPLKTLLINTKKMEEGKTIKVSDILANDEMGYLLSCFYMMYEKVHEHTEFLNFKATHDELTGLKNRESLLDTINSQIVTSISDEKKMAILFLDLNKFKFINDTYGHEVGDALLIEVSNRLNKTMRNEDSIFRLGGDEFVILIKNLMSSTHIQTIVTKILKSFQEQVRINDHHIPISMSIGISVAPDDSEDPEELLKMADLAMYVAKKEKDNHYKFFEKSMYKK